jgi:hypothetical protein
MRNTTTAALSAMVSKTRCRRVGKDLITRGLSLLAACWSRVWTSSLAWLVGSEGNGSKVATDSSDGMANPVHQTLDRRTGTMRPPTSAFYARPSSGEIEARAVRQGARLHVLAAQAMYGIDTGDSPDAKAVPTPLGPRPSSRMVHAAIGARMS